MFDVLVFSGAPIVLKPRWVSTSVGMHALAALAAVTVTRAALESPSAVRPDDAVLLFVPKAPPPPPAKAEPEPPAPAVIVTQPPPKGFQTVVALQDIPDMIPPVDLTQRALDPRDFTGQGVEGGVAAGVVGGTGTADIWAAGPAADAIYEATTVDERFTPATVVSQPAPRYPRHLEAAGLPGRVLVQFVIDTAGHVEPASIRSLESSHPAFEEAAQAAMLGSLFKPARMSGHPVRQLTRQSIRFVSASTP
jgi:protein TonB